jgi:hypothetical protein
MNFLRSIVVAQVNFVRCDKRGGHQLTPSIARAKEVNHSAEGNADIDSVRLDGSASRNMSGGSFPAAATRSVTNLIGHPVACMLVVNFSLFC